MENNMGKEFSPLRMVRSVKEFGGMENAKSGVKKIMKNDCGFQKIKMIYL